jgi:hypothetical protein
MPGRLLAKAQAFTGLRENLVCVMRRSRHQSTAKAHGPWPAWWAWFRKEGWTPLSAGGEDFAGFANGGSGGISAV